MTSARCRRRRRARPCAPAAERLGAVEQVDVGGGDQREAADDRHAAERLHGGVHHLARRLVVRLAVLVDARHRLDRHRVGHRVLDHVAGRREQRGQHEPALGAHHRAHRLDVADQADHDEQARRDHRRAEPHQQRLPAPDQVDHVADRHLERPRNAGPERERGEERGRETEVVLDEERADDAGEARDPVRRVHHQRRQVGEPHQALMTRIGFPAIQAATFSTVSR